MNEQMPMADEEWTRWYENLHPLARGVVDGINEAIESTTQISKERRMHMSEDKYKDILAALAERANKRVFYLLISMMACVLAMFGLLIAKK